jgi:hypothetical protein
MLKRLGHHPVTVGDGALVVDRVAQARIDGAPSMWC